MNLALRKRYDPSIRLSLEIKGELVKIGSPGFNMEIGDYTDQIKLDLLNAKTYAQRRAIEDRVTYANYFVAMWLNKMEDDKKMFLNGFMTAEQYGTRATEWNCDIEFVEMRILLEEIRSMQAEEKITKATATQLAPQNIRATYWKFWDFIFGTAIVLALYFLFLHRK